MREIGRNAQFAETMTTDLKKEQYDTERQVPERIKSE